MTTVAAPTALPRRPMTTPELFYLSIHWFSLNFHWGALLTVAIQAEVLRFVTVATQGRALASVFSSGALVALIVMPLAGAASDHSRSRFGRRRPFVLAGALLNAIALLVFAGSPSLGWLIAAYAFVQFANNLGGSAYSGLIPDLVPPEQRGAASGFMGLMTMLGTIAGSVTAGILLERGLRLPLYLTVIAVLFVTTAVTLWKVRERPRPEGPPFDLPAVLRGFRIDPRRHPDFAWLFGSRLATLMGFYTLLAFLQFFLKDVLRVPNFTEATGWVTAAVVGGALGSAFAAGWLSDRTGRRGIASAAGALMGAMCLVFLAAPSLGFLLGLGVVFGLGYGAFLSVEWALATDVLPERGQAAKYLGIWGISATLPQVIGPMMGGLLLDPFNRLGSNLGYTVLFVIGSIYFAAGAGLIWKIRGAR
jgi:MFS family permease